MSENHKKVCKALNYFEHIFIFISASSGFVSISLFPSLIGTPVGITSSALELKLVQSLRELKSIHQISRKTEKTRDQNCSIKQYSINW